MKRESSRSNLFELYFANQISARDRASERLQISWEFQHCLPSDTIEEGVIEAAISGYVIEFFAFLSQLKQLRISMLNVCHT